MAEHERVRVVLEFDIDPAELSRLGGDDFKGRGQGITTASGASAILRGHDPALGYVRWSASGGDHGG